MINEFSTLPDAFPQTYLNEKQATSYKMLQLQRCPSLPNPAGVTPLQPGITTLLPARTQAASQRGIAGGHVRAGDHAGEFPRAVTPCWIFLHPLQGIDMHFIVGATGRSPIFHAFKRFAAFVRQGDRGSPLHSRPRARLMALMPVNRANPPTQGGRREKGRHIGLPLRNIINHSKHQNPAQFTALSPRRGGPDEIRYAVTPSILPGGPVCPP